MPAPTITIKLHRDVELRLSLAFIGTLEERLGKPLPTIIADIESVQDKLKAAGEAQDNRAIFTALPVATALDFVSKATGEPGDAISEACSVGQIYAAYFQIAGAIGASLGDDSGKG